MGNRTNHIRFQVARHAGQAPHDLVNNQQPHLVVHQRAVGQYNGANQVATHEVVGHDATGLIENVGLVLPYRQNQQWFTYAESWSSRLLIGHHQLTTVTIVPFRPWRPDPAQAQEVISPPFDVPTREEAIALARCSPRHFLHVVRAEVDLPENVDPHDAQVYKQAQSNLVRLQKQRVLVRERHPALYLYRMEDRSHCQTGIVACVRAADYDAGLIRTHERTRAAQEDDRVHHMRALRAHAEPVLFTYRPSPGIRELLSRLASGAPLLAVTDANGVRHLVWRLTDPASLIEAFAAVPRLYVADGHHRTAAAARLATLGGAASHFPAVLFPSNELRILSYNRAIRGLGGQTEDKLLQRLGEIGRVVHPAASVPAQAGVFAVRLRSGWYQTNLKRDSEDRADSAAALDVELLQRHVLGPLLDVGDPRTDQRFIPVGGIESIARIEQLVDSGEAAIGFSLFPPTVDQMLAVADVGGVMPPKSTWIEPKLQSGLFVHPFGSDEKRHTTDSRSGDNDR